MTAVKRRLYVTTAMPYVNAAPHLGHALELVQADVLVRHARLRGRQARLMAGTDEHAIKNVTAARAAGETDTLAFVTRNSEQFRRLSDELGVGLDDFIRTTERRHVQGVEKLWRLTEAQGDFYQKTYEGRYCYGCEQFVTEDDLVDGVCPEHLRPPEQLSETNWFFRLSRYQERIERLIESGELKIIPESGRAEVLAFVRRGLKDISVSRPVERTEGWGVPVPGHPEQTIYVWWDALTNYINSAGYGTDEELYRTWWGEGADRIHLQGKGIVKFQAVYWPALLLSAGQPLPTHLYVHQYLTANGVKLSKTTGNLIDPFALLQQYGPDAVRWWLASAPRDSDLDFTDEKLVAKHNAELAKGLGNVVNRVLGIVTRARGGAVPSLPAKLTVAAPVVNAARALPGQIDAALAEFNVRAVGEAITKLLDPVNLLIQEQAPWALAGSENPADQQRLDEILAALVDAGRVIAREASVIIPQGAARLLAQLGEGGVVSAPEAVFARLETADRDVSATARDSAA